MRFSVSSYSYQQYINDGRMTQLDAVKKAAEMGFEGIEFIDLMPCPNPTFADQLEYAETIRIEAERTGIAIVAYTVGADLYKGSSDADAREVERLCGQVDVAHALGAKLLRHDVCYSERVGDRVLGFSRMLPTIAANARRITEYAATRGVRTCTENHGYIAQDSDRVEALWASVNHDNYGLLIDMGNFACADESSVHAVSRLAALAVHVHAKDFHIYPFGSKPPKGVKAFSSRGGAHLVGCSVGDGDIPVTQCLSILKHAGYDGWLSVEYEGTEDCIKGIGRGLQFLKKTVGEL